MLEVSEAVDWDAAPEGLDRITADLRAMRNAAGAPSFNEITRRISVLREQRGIPLHERRVARSTVWASFQEGRRRLDADAVVEIAAALGLPEPFHATWAQRVRAARTAADAAFVAVARPQAPVPVPSFAGRAREVSATATALSEDRRVWITGMPGSGKTQLAFMAVQQLNSGGSVFLDLRGRNAESPPVAPEAAQRAILRQLKVDDSATKTSADRAHLILTALAVQDCALILDDATDYSHVDAIIGPGGTGRVVATSRSLHEDADWQMIRLLGLDQNETTALLRRFAPGVDISAADSERLSTISGGLPLAVALVGARLATHAEWTLGEHIDLMTERLNSDRVDDEVRATLELSYAELDAHAAQLLRIFADLPIAEIDAESAAAAIETEPGAATVRIAALADANLAIRRDDDRIALHALVRAFARERANETDPPRMRSSAFERVALQATQKTWGAYATIARSMSDSPRRSDFVYPERDWTADEASDWLYSQLSSLLAMAHAAPERGHPEILFHLSDGLSWWMNIAGRTTEALRLHQAAAEVASEIGAGRALATSSLDAGQLLLYSDDPRSAQAHFDRARILVDETGQNPDLRMAGLLTNMSALVDLRLGQVPAAIEKLQRTVQLHENKDDEVPLCLSALVNLGLSLHTAGRFDEERDTVLRGLELAVSVGHRLFEANLRTNYATVLLEYDQFEEAILSADAARTIAEELGHPYLTVYSEVTAAKAMMRLGDPTAALVRAEDAITTSRSLGQPLVTTEALIHSTPIALAAGEHDRAMRMLDEAEPQLGEQADNVLRGRLLQLRADSATDPADRDKLLRAAVEQFELAGSYLANDIRDQVGAR
ncbi:NB-ARC domain-containing protein [Microbacterium sp. A94]|uniref:NB-ARC domain-containing protein n=1 Tax=Microbacterium sp. A94 TaxID=3450717 RepID=UPI003F42FFE0